MDKLRLVIILMDKELYKFYKICSEAHKYFISLTDIRI